MRVKKGIFVSMFFAMILFVLHVNAPYASAAENWSRYYGEWYGDDYDYFLRLRIGIDNGASLGLIYNHPGGEYPVWGAEIKKIPDNGAATFEYQEPVTEEGKKGRIFHDGTIQLKDDKVTITFTDFKDGKKKTLVFDKRYDLIDFMINDPNLEALIREALQKPEGVLTMADLASLTSLNGVGNNISDLGGLEHAVNLVTLDLDQNSVVSIEPLRGLDKLKELYLGCGNQTCGNKLVDLSVLKSLPSLEVLAVSNATLEEKIDDLQSIPKLKKLYLDGGWYRLDKETLPLLSLSAENTNTLGALLDRGVQISTRLQYFPQYPEVIKAYEETELLTQAAASLFNR